MKENTQDLSFSVQFTVHHTVPYSSTLFTAKDRLKMAKWPTSSRTQFCSNPYAAEWPWTSDLPSYTSLVLRLQVHTLMSRSHRAGDWTQGFLCSRQALCQSPGALKSFIYISISMHTCACSCMSSCALRGGRARRDQKRAPDCQEWSHGQLWGTVWEAGFEPGSSPRTVSTLTPVLSLQLPPPIWDRLFHCSPGWPGIHFISLL